MWFCGQHPQCYYKQLQRLKQENELKRIQNEELYADLAISNRKLIEYKKALEEIREIVKEISYLGSRGERELKFKIKNILEDIIDEEVY